MASTAPTKTWADLRELGLAARRHADGRPIGNGSAVDAWASKAAATKTRAEFERAVEEQAAAPLGPVGRLALCEPGDALGSAAAVLMAAAHAVVLGEARAMGVELQVAGNGEDGALAPQWPELFPAGWASPGGFGFKYRVLRLAKAEGDAAELAKSFTLLLKGTTMGKNLLALTALASQQPQLPPQPTQQAPPQHYQQHQGGDEEALVTCQLVVKDFVAGAAGAAAVQAALAGADGLCSLVTRASALQLAATLRDGMLAPLLRPLRPKGALTETAEAQATASADAAVRQPPRGWPRGFPAPAPYSPGLTVGGPRGGYGQSDLYPALGPAGPGGFFPGGGLGAPGGGGMLYGPGNRLFDERFGNLGGVPGRLPPGVPPGARFDPYGPPGVVPRGPPPPGRAGPRGVGGEPDPDELPPPGNSRFADDLYM
jgi:hypothetical protein